MDCCVNDQCKLTEHSYNYIILLLGMTNEDGLYYWELVMIAV